MRILSPYLFPEHRVGIFIVAALTVLGAGWLISLITSWVRLIRARRTIDSLVTIAPTLIGHLQVMPEEATTAYAGVIAEFHLDRRHAIVKHVESIFLAGVADARLDVAELLRHTEGTLIRGDVARRYLLGVFIIIGLLGTLFGLADSLIALSGNIGATRSQPGLLDVLTGLRSAFAPSVWGIFWSILGTLMFSAYQRFAVGPTFEELQRATLTKWVLTLYPTAGQRLLEATRVSLETVQQVAAFANDVREDTGRLRSAVSTSVKATDQFAKRLAEVRGLLETADLTLQQRLADLAERLTQFGGTLRQWEDMAGRWSRIQDAMLTLQHAQQERLGELKQLLVDQGRSLESREDEFKHRLATLADPIVSVAQQLQTLVGDFVRVLGGALDTLRAELGRQTGVLNASQNALVSTMNALSAELSQALVGQLNVKTDELLVQLRQFDETVRRLRLPFESAADRLVNIALAFEQAAEAMVADVRPRAVPESAPRHLDPALFGRIDATLREILAELRTDRSQPYRLVRRIVEWFQG